MSRRVMILGGLLVACAATGLGAFYQEINSSAKATVTSICNPLSCTTDGKVQINIAGKIELAPAEEAALTETAVIHIEYQGLMLEFPLGADPKFQNGDTSVKYTTTSLENFAPGATGSQQVTLKWGNGVLDVKASLTVDSSDAVSPHPSSSTVSSSVVTKALGLDKGDKDHLENYTADFIVELDTHGDPGGFAVRAEVRGLSKTTTKDTVNGDISSETRVKLNLKSNDWDPIIL